MKMKYLLNGVAVIAALAFSAPVWAQANNPGNANTGGNAMGMPGPNMGGPGLTPYSTAAPPPAPAPSGRMPAGGRRTSGERIPPIMPETSSASDTTSAAPPTHRHARHVTHAAAHHKMEPLTGSTANQLNQEELARLQGDRWSQGAGGRDLEGVWLSDIERCGAGARDRRLRQHRDLDGLCRGCAVGVAGALLPAWRVGRREPYALVRGEGD